MKTVKHWRRWQPQQTPARARPIDEHAEFIRRHAPEVAWNRVVVHRELRALCQR